MSFIDWISGNYIEIFGAVTGIIYVILEIRQNIWLWPVGIVTSAVYILVFFTSKFYADMSLQGYYLVISVLGWYWWIKGAGRRAQGAGRRAQGKGHRAQGVEQEGMATQLPSLEGLGVGFEKSGSESKKLRVSRLKMKTGIILTVVFSVLYAVMWMVLDRLTDSPVPAWDSFITSLSVIATWMLARKIYEHWYLWILVNAASAVLFLTRGLYPTVILYAVYCIMSFTGLKAWRRTL